MTAKLPKPKSSAKGRPSRLTDEQKEDVRKRLLAGEAATSIGRRYGVDEKVIRRIKSEVCKTDGKARLPVDTIKEAAQKSLQNDLQDPDVRTALEKMGAQDRDLFYNHKNDLLEITLQLNLSSKLSAQNAHKLAAMAQNHLSKIETDGVIDDEARLTLKDAMSLQMSSNEAAKQPMKLYEIATKQPPPPPEDEPLRIIGGLPDELYD